MELSQSRSPGGRLTVMRVIDRLNVGGPAIHAVLTAARLDPGRFRTILVYGDIEPDEGDMSYLLQKHGIEAVHLPGWSRGLSPAADLRALFTLVHLMRAARCDIVHTHKSKAGLVGRTAAVLAGVPVRIHTYHGHVLSGYFSPMKSRAFIALEKLLSSCTTRLVTLSRELQTELAQVHRIAPKERIRVVPLGLDLLPFRAVEPGQGTLRRELGLPGEARLIGLVGRMVPIKDHGTFIAAFAKLLRHEGRGGFHAALVGSGTCEDEIRRDVVRRGLASRVHFLGWRRDLPALYGSLDLLALTSRNEGTPVAVIEALAAGVPVVATAVGGVADVLRGGALGSLVEAGNPARFAAAMARVLCDPGALARARDPRRRDEVCATYGIERLCSDLATLYESELRGATRLPMQSPTRLPTGLATDLPKNLIIPRGPSTKSEGDSSQEHCHDGSP